MSNKIIDEEAHRHHIQYLYQPSISPRPNRITGHHGDKQGSEQDHKFRNPFLLYVFGIRPIILYILLLPVKINKDSDKITDHLRGNHGSVKITDPSIITGDLMKYTLHTLPHRNG